MARKAFLPIVSFGTSILHHPDGLLERTKAAFEVGFAGVSASLASDFSWVADFTPEALSETAIPKSTQCLVLHCACPHEVQGQIFSPKSDLAVLEWLRTAIGVAAAVAKHLSGTVRVLLSFKANSEPVEPAHLQIQRAWLVTLLKYLGAEVPKNVTVYINVDSDGKRAPIATLMDAVNAVASTPFGIALPMLAEPVEALQRGLAKLQNNPAPILFIVPDGETVGGNSRHYQSMMRLFNTHCGKHQPAEIPLLVSCTGSHNSVNRAVGVVEAMELCANSVGLPRRAATQ